MCDGLSQDLLDRGIIFEVFVAGRRNALSTSRTTFNLMPALG